MKLTIKLFLVIVITASTILAEGDMNTGGRTCTIDCPIPPPISQSINGTGEQNSGETNSEAEGEIEGDDSIVTIIENYLKSLFG